MNKIDTGMNTKVGQIKLTFCKSDMIESQYKPFISFNIINLQSLRDNKHSPKVAINKKLSINTPVIL